MEEQAEKLLDATKTANDILLKVETVFPFTLFPDTVMIDREKLSIARRFFFRVAHISGTPLDDIEAVDVDVGPFFGTIKITSKFFVNNINRVRYLTRADAIRIQELLQGYKLTKEKKIDLAKIDTRELVKMLIELGKGRTG